MGKKASNEVFKEVAWHISIAQDLIEKENFTNVRDKISIGIKSLSQSRTSLENEDNAELNDLLESIDSLTNKTINAFNQYKLSLKQYDDAAKSYRNLEEKVKRLEESSSKMHGVSTGEEAAELIELDSSRQLLRSTSFPRDNDYGYREKEGKYQEFKRQLNDTLGKFLSRVKTVIGQDKEIDKLIKQAVTDGAIKLDLSCHFLHKLPPKIFKLTNLVELNLSYNHIHNLPPEISQLTNLTVLNLSFNHLQSLPYKIGQLTELTELYIHDNNLKRLPPKFVELINLRVLDVSNNQITKLSPKIGQLTNLKDIHTNGNYFKVPPQEIAKQGLAAIKEYFQAKSIPAASSKRNLKVFLCHSSSDKPAVEKFYNMLVNDGIDAWLDKKNLIPGQDWRFEIPKAVRSSDVVIAFLSSTSVTKEGFVQKEIKIALDTADEKPEGTIFIIPARLEDCIVPDRLSKFHWVDLFEKDGYEFLFKALQRRASSLSIILNRKILEARADSVNDGYQNVIENSDSITKPNIFQENLMRNIELLQDALKNFNELDDQRERYSWVKYINDLLEERRRTLRQLGEEITSEPLGTIDGKPVSSRSELSFKHGSTYGSNINDDPDRIIYVDVKDGKELCEACGEYGLGRIRVEGEATLCWDCAVEYQTKWRINHANRARINPKVRSFIDSKQNKNNMM